MKLLLRLPKVDINDLEPWFGQAAWGRAQEMERKRKEDERKMKAQRRRDARLPGKLGSDLLGYEEEGIPKGRWQGSPDKPEPEARREDIPDWVIEDFGDVDFGEFTLEEVWDDVNEVVTLVEKLGLVPGQEVDEQEGVMPEALKDWKAIQEAGEPKTTPEAPEKPEGVGDLPAPEGEETPIPETMVSSDVGAEKVLEKPAQQGEDEDEQKSKEELLNIWEGARKSDVKMMEQYGSGEMELKDVEWEVNWLNSLEPGDLEDVVYGRRAVVEEEDLVGFLADQGIGSSDDSDYAISDLPLSELDSGGRQRVARHLGMGGSEPGIQYTDAIDQVELLQNYWGLDDREMLSVLREIYYRKALDPFIADAKDDKIPDLTEEAVELGDGTIITKEDAAYALTVLILGQPLSGDLDESDPALGYRGALVPVMAGEGEAGFDHVIAGLEGFENPANENDDIQMRPGPKRTGIKILGSIKIVAGEAVSWEGDLGSVVAERLKNQGFSLNDAYGVGMPRQDFEGDILAAVIYAEGLIDSEGLSGALRAVYDPQGPYYPHRYEIFAISILAPKNEDGNIVEGMSIESLINPMTGEINADVRETFIEAHWNNVGNYAIGIIKSDREDDPEDYVDYWDGFDLRPSEQVTNLAKEVLNYYLDELERAMREEKAAQ